jgi:hypothetical protein
MIAVDKEDAVMVSPKTDLLHDELKGIYRCVICECLLIDMAEDTINRRAQEDLLTEDDMERINLDISATIEPDYRIKKSKKNKRIKNNGATAKQKIID